MSQTVNVLSVYQYNMGVSFWKNQVVDQDEVCQKTEEDFGISHNRTFDVEAFQDIMSEYGYDETYDQYIVVENEELIETLLEEFDLENE